MRSSLFSDVTQRRLIVTDVLGRPVGPNINGRTEPMRLLVCPETSLTNPRCVTSQKSEYLIFTQRRKPEIPRVLSIYPRLSSGVFEVRNPTCGTEKQIVGWWNYEYKLKKKYKVSLWRYLWDKKKKFTDSLGIRILCEGPVDNSNFWNWVVVFPSYTTKQLQYHDSIIRTLFWKAESTTWRKSRYENTRACKRRFIQLFFNSLVRFKRVRSAQKQRWRAIFASWLPTFRDNPSVSSWPLNTEPIGCPETSVTTNTRCVTS